MRKCLAVFVILYGVVLFVASRAPNQPTFVACGALLVIGSCMIFNLGMPTLINRWFKDYSGTIIGVCAAMTGFGGLVFIPIGQAVMQSGIDFHTPFIVYGIITIVVLLPIVLFGVSSYPADRGLLPYVSKKSATSTGSAAEAVKEKNWTVDVNKSMKSSAFWTFTLGLGIANFVLPAGFLWPWIAENFGGYGSAFALAIVMIVIFAILWMISLHSGRKIEHVEDTTTVVDAE